MICADCLLIARAMNKLPQILNQDTARKEMSFLEEVSEESLGKGLFTNMNRIS
jgi:hypothetical protein